MWGVWEVWGAGGAEEDEIIIPSLPHSFTPSPHHSITPINRGAISSVVHRGYVYVSDRLFDHHLHQY